MRTTLGRLLFISYVSQQIRESVITAAMAPQVIYLETGQEVKNIIGSSEATPGAKAFWERHAGRGWPANCCAKYCKNRAEHGGHVKLVGGGERHYWTWFIVPVCRNPHNLPGSDTRFAVCAGTVAVEDERADFQTHVKSWGHHSDNDGGCHIS